MKFFFKCFVIFISLSVLLTLASEFLFPTSLPLSGNILYSSFASLLLALLYGWIDAVYIHPGIEEQ